ncbi:hypothetical protein KO516_10080 [Citreicella sp. C3M06]|uniref:hypothetical protein n=1 Tax=Citreicella sp. C3M06 TaxID=2841564 RepID=UPI001C08FF20|nr:hypothetical protein [Citreicella sp. C3M06]MBU2961154.1 hypothetical protein [Citreicella sp. C3M06]
MIALAAPLAPVPMAIGAAALLPGGIAERLDLLGICILTGLTAALCAALGVLYVLTLPPPQELGRSKRRSVVQTLDGNTSFLPDPEPLRRAG